MKRCLYIWLLLMCAMNACPLVCACSFRNAYSKLDDACRTLTVADSLRVQAGVAYDDSLALADAFTMLRRVRLFFPDDYARACYYYGRLLRNRGDQVAAMQAFIAGIHAPYIHRIIPLPYYSDYHILGRIYSNMGTMCHLVDEFELAYLMYENSSAQFCHAGDTTMYYYARNAMALQLAEQNKHIEALALLQSIEHECTNSDILTKLWETKAQLYLNIARYDSAIYASKQLYSHGYSAVTGYVVEAQSFWCMEKYDSAVYYANLVINDSYASEQDKYHMLYILVNHDTILDKHNVQTLAAERADLDYMIIEPLLQQLSIATELLKQDIAQNPSLQKIILYLIILVLVGVIVIYVSVTLNKRITHQLNRHTLLQKENDDIRKSSEILKQQDYARQKQKINDIESTCELIRHSNNWDMDICWKNYSELCKFINDHFYLLADKLKYTYGLDEKEMRLSILVLLDMFNNYTIAQILHYGKGIRTYKSRLNAKLGNKGNDLRTKLIKIAVSPSEYLT